MSKPTKYYAVRAGRKPGVYDNWAECQSQVKDFPGAVFKSFDSKSEAGLGFHHGWDKNGAFTRDTKTKTGHKPNTLIKDSLTVSTFGEKRIGAFTLSCYHTDTGKRAFGTKTYPVTSRNIAEFLNVVQALRYLYARGLTIPIYTTSQSAIAWVRDCKVNTDLYRADDTAELFSDVDNAIVWLEQNEYSNLIIKLNKGDR